MKSSTRARERRYIEEGSEGDTPPPHSHHPHPHPHPHPVTHHHPHTTSVNTTCHIWTRACYMTPPTTDPRPPSTPYPQTTPFHTLTHPCTSSPPPSEPLPPPYTRHPSSPHSSRTEFWVFRFAPAWTSSSRQLTWPFCAAAISAVAPP